MLKTFDLNASKVEQYASNVATGSAPAASTRTSSHAQSSATGAVGNQSTSVSLGAVYGTQAGVASGGATAAQANSEVQTSAVSSANAQGGAIAGSAALSVQSDAIQSAQAQGSAIAGGTGQTIQPAQTSSAQAQDHAIASSTGQVIASTTAHSAQAQDNAIAGSTGQSVQSAETTGVQAQGAATPGGTGQAVEFGTAHNAQAQSSSIAGDTGHIIQTAEARGVPTQGAVIQGSTGQTIESGEARSAQAQASTVAGGTGQAIRPVATQHAQAQDSAIAAGTGQSITAGAAHNAQAQGNTTVGQTASQVVQASGGANTPGTVPGMPAVGSIMTVQPNLQLPTASLFKTHAESQSGYLIETDPKFTQYKQWSSSVYLLNALQMDPATTQKRLGDGFYEQKLVREQVLTLTGHRFLADYTSDDQEYKALMDNGLTVAKQFKLRPGIALTAAQVAQLTSDIVWLVTQDVQLPDGSHQSVLVPQVYVHVRPGDVNGSGGLLSGSDVDLNLSGDVSNSGKIAGRNLVRISADNIRNMGGSMVADTLALQAAGDIDNIGGAMQAQSAAVLTAGHDLNVTTTAQGSNWSNGANSYSRSGIDRVAGLYVSGPAGVLLASAGHDINLTAAQIGNAGSGLTQFSADNDLNLGTVTTGRTRHEFSDSNNHLDSSTSMQVGTQLKTAGALTLNAGQDVNARAATVNAGQALTVLAGRDVNVLAGQASQSVDAASRQTSHGFLSKKTVATHEQSQSTAALGSSLEGGSVQIQAARDVNVKGSSIIADQGLLIDAARNLSVLSVEETYKSFSSKDMKKSGLTGGFASGVVSLGYGKSGAAAQNGLETVTQAASSIGSLNGSVQLKSGETLQVVASDIAAKENLGLVGKNVDLAAAQNTSQGQQSAQSKSYGFSAGLTVNPLAAFKDAYKADTANTKNGSFIGRELGKGEGAGDGAWAATTVVTTQFGSQSANSTQNHAISAARASSLTAGKDLTIIATDGSISSQGAQMSAEGNALLLAKNHILFDAAHTVEGQTQDARKSGFSFDNRSPMMVGTLHNQGNGNGATDTVTGTKLSVGGNASMATQTGDIALTGANVVSEGQLSINAARNLTISSAQDMVHNANQSDNKAVGKVVISDTERFAGYHNEKHLDNSSQVTQAASNIGSLKGDVVLTAGGKYTQAASNVTAGNDVNISAKTIDITALDNMGSNQAANSDLKIGAFARISSPLIDLVNNVAAARKSDGRLKAMQGMAAVANGVQAATSMSSGLLVKGEAGIGFASSSNSSKGNGSTAEGSTINAKGNVNLAATGGDIHASGATLNAGKALNLDAAQNIVLDASQSTVHSDGKNHSAGAEVGVGYQVGAQTGFYIYAAANVGNGRNNSDATINNNTELKADTINLHSKGDTTLRGGTAIANTINAEIGGKLAIESLQDSSKEESSQTGVGVRVEFGFGVMNASGSVSQAKSNGSATSVGQQSGLIAGDGGYHVKADAIDLKGGAIASTNATTSDLVTNKLTTSNLENKMNYSASSVSLAGSISGESDFGKEDAQGKTIPFTTDSQLFGDRKGGNVTPGLPMMEKGSDSATTYATVTDGKITIGGVTASSVKDLGVNTDASKANIALDKLPDMQKLLKDQQAMSAAAGTVIATAKQVSAAFTSDARKAEEAAQKTLKNPGSTPEQIADANKTIDESIKVQAEWGVGGDKSRALNVVTGILVGGVAGQGGAQIAANAAAPYVAAEIGDYFKTKGNENQTLQDVSHAVLGAALAVANHSSALGGALSGGGGELAAQILTKELYPQAFDANGTLQREKLTPEQANNVTALSGAIGALLSGAGGGSMHDAAIGGQVAMNAVENNALNARQGVSMMKEVDRCKRNGCSQANLLTIRDKYLAISNTNEEVEYLIKLFGVSSYDESSNEVVKSTRKLLPPDTIAPVPGLNQWPKSPVSVVGSFDQYHLKSGAPNEV